MFWTKKKQEEFRKQIIEEVMAAEAAKREEEERIRAEEEAEKARIAEEEAAKKAKEPHIEIKSAGVDPQKGIQIELDWNTAFIEHLKRHGFEGMSEEEIIQKYLARLYHGMITDFGPGDQSFE